MPKNASQQYYNACKWYKKNFTPPKKATANPLRLS